MRIFDKKGKLVTPVMDQGQEILVLDTLNAITPTPGIYVKHTGSDYVELLVPLSSESVKYIKQNGGTETPVENSTSEFKLLNTMIDYWTADKVGETPYINLKATFIDFQDGHIHDNEITSGPVTYKAYYNKLKTPFKTGNLVMRKSGPDDMNIDYIEKIEDGENMYGKQVSIEIYIGDNLVQQYGERPWVQNNRVVVKMDKKPEPTVNE